MNGKMTKNEIFTKIQNILMDDYRVPKDRITIESEFSDNLLLDSADRLSLLLKIEDVFSLEIPDNYAERMTMVKYVVTYLYNKQYEGMKDVVEADPQDKPKRYNFSHGWDALNEIKESCAELSNSIDKMANTVDSNPGQSVIELSRAKDRLLSQIKAFDPVLHHNLDAANADEFNENQKAGNQKDR